MKFEKLEINGRRYVGDLTVVRVTNVATEDSKKREPASAGSIVGGITGGAVAKYAWSGFQATHTVTQDQVIKSLVSNGLSSHHAPAAADAALEIIRSEPTKVLLVAVSAGGGTWALLEAGSKLFGRRLSKMAKFIASVGVAVVAAAVYIALRSAGYLG